MFKPCKEPGKSVGFVFSFNSYSGNFLVICFVYYASFNLSHINYEQSDFIRVMCMEFLLKMQFVCEILKTIFSNCWTQTSRYTHWVEIALPLYNI